MRSINVLGVRVDDVTMTEALMRAEDMMQEARLHHIATVNPEYIVAAQKVPEFARVLDQADMNLPDGANLLRAAEAQGTPLRERVAGTDFVWYFTGIAAVCGWSMFLLGGRKGAGAQAAARLQSRYRHLRIAGTYEGSPAPEEEAEILSRINESGAEILLVAYGAPAQDLWIHAHREQLSGIRLAIGVGGALDFIAQRVRRAPRWMQNRGLEWLFRLMMEPRRVRRQWALVQFTWMVFRRRRRGRRSPTKNSVQVTDLD
jgi:N-acetylglucosaminyldiphosphoundecaprenol N-acetyl-beta-D-mannosaminyltransferase